MASSKKILVIDDEPEIAEILCDLLITHYPLVESMTDSNQARERLEKESFSLIISDINMPGLPGPELIRFLRARGDWTLVMFLTGNATKENVLSALRLGVVDVLEKPFDEDVLLQTIQRIFEIEKRKNGLVLEQAGKELSKEQLEQKNKMLGLLHLANEKKTDDKKKPA